MYKKKNGSYKKKSLDKKKNGFTLIELLVVIIILSVMASLAIPNLGQMLKKLQNRSEAQKLASFFKYARYQAVVEGINYKVVCEPANKSCWIAKQNKEDFVRIMDKTLLLSGETKIDSPTAPVIFYPLGSSTGGKIGVDDYWVIIEKLTGRIKVEKRK